MQFGYSGASMQLEMERGRQFALLFFILSVAKAAAQSGGATAGGTIPVHVGLVLDAGTLVGETGRTSIAMAVEDFYGVHANYTTRLVLHTRDSQTDAISAASAALDLLGNVHVEAIIGPQKSTQAVFISDLGNQTHVPIISFSATSPLLSSFHTPYFVRTASNDSSQASAISSLLKAFAWREVVLIYEDTTFGVGVIPSLMDAVQGVDARVPYRSVISLSATDDQIQEELYKLMTMPTRVFLVHMSPTLASRVFFKANAVGMMNKGYAWIMTDSITSVLDSQDPVVLDSMQGLLGVRHYVPPSRELDVFAFRWERRFRLANPGVRKVELSIYGLWAYDTVWALALAAEQVGTLASQFRNTQASNASIDLESLGASQMGPKLLEAISKQQFVGLSGRFLLIDGQLQSSTFQVINVIGRGGREVGFWTPSLGLSRRLGVPSLKETPSASITDLGTIIWPGDSTSVPKGWEKPTSGKKLRIGVPVKDGFGKYFVRVERDPLTNRTTVSGYCIDIFEAVLQVLPYSISYEYIPFENATGQAAGTYNDLVYQVYLQKYDAVVGDTTIRANRSLYVDFTLPFTEAGLAMVVPVEEDPNKNAWIFLKPLTVDLWLVSLAFFFYTGIVVWIIEHRISYEFRGGPFSRQFGAVFYFSFSTLVFAHKEKIESILSKFVVIVWVFVVLILASSYTASLTSMLTVQQLQPTVTSVKHIQKDGGYVGFHEGSFMEGVLLDLKFDRSKLRPLDLPDDYVNALSKGSSNGGVSAVVHEIPYIKLFLSQHCSGYTMVGIPSVKTEGFGFVFPKGSPLVPDISRAILSVTEGEKMVEIEKKWFGDHTACLNQGSIVSSNNLSFRSFWGLFLITGATSTCALFISLFIFLYKNWDELKRHTLPEDSLWQRLVAWAKVYDKRDENAYAFKNERAGATQKDDDADGGSTERDQAMQSGTAGSQSPLSTCTLSITSTSTLSDGGSSPSDDAPSLNSQLIPV